MPSQEVPLGAIAALFMRMPTWQRREKESEVRSPPFSSADSPPQIPLRHGRDGRRQAREARWLTSPHASYTLSRRRSTSSSLLTSVGTEITLASPTILETSAAVSLRPCSFTSAMAILSPILGVLSRWARGAQARKTRVLTSRALLPPRDQYRCLRR